VITDRNRRVHNIIFYTRASTGCEIGGGGGGGEMKGISTTTEGRGGGGALRRITINPGQGRIGPIPGQTPPASL